MNISDDSVADYGMGFTEIVHAPAEIAIIPGCGNLEHGDHKNVSKTFVDFGVHV